MREKWMGFFRQGQQRASLDTDRVLKNTVARQSAEFISDQLLTMNDLQIIRSIFILSSSNKVADIRLKDRCNRFLLSNLQAGKFEFKKGNTLVAFAQMANNLFDNQYLNSKDIRLDIYNSTLVHGRASHHIPTPTTGMLHIEYEMSARIAKQFVPFYKYYFDYYKLSQKLVAMRFLSNYKVYDKTLAMSFVTSLNTFNLHNYCKAAKKEDPFWVAQHPITNEKINRFYEMLDVLDFIIRADDGQ